MDGFPIHEIVGEVLASRHPEHQQGDRVVGWASGFDGLMARVVADGDGLAGYDSVVEPALAVGLQPLACVLYALEQLPGIADATSPSSGRARSACCSPMRQRLWEPATSPASTRSTVPRSPAAFGVDTVVRATSDRWVSHLDPKAKPDIVIEAVGHQVATLGSTRWRPRRPAAPCSTSACPTTTAIRSACARCCATT